jgi:hypothetical protein
VTALGAAARLVTLSAQSFSPAETAYALAARSDPWNLHGLLLAAAAWLFGSGDAVLRAPSALAGIGTVPAVYALARRLAPRNVALACAALVAVAPIHIALSQDARPFSLVLLLSVAAAHAALGALGRARVSRWGVGLAELPRPRRPLAVAGCAMIVPVAAAAVALAAWRPVKPDWRGAATALEARIRAEDLLVFDVARSETAYLRYALRADDRVALDAPAARISRAFVSRDRAWLVLSDAGREGAARRALPGGWREAERVLAPGVEAVLLERSGGE